MTPGIYTADVDTHRVDLRDGRLLLGYAVLDAFGWVFMARRRGQRHPSQILRLDPRPGDSPGLLRMLVHRRLFALGAAREVA